MSLVFDEVSRRARGHRRPLKYVFKRRGEKKTLSVGRPPLLTTPPLPLALRLPRPSARRAARTPFAALLAQYGRPYIIIRDQESKSRLKGLECVQLPCRLGSAPPRPTARRRCKRHAVNVGGCTR